MLKPVRGVILLLVMGLIASGMALSDETPSPAPKEEPTMPHRQVAGEATKIEEVVVTAPRIKSPADDVPASITVISREDIKASPFEKVDDILRETAGVNVNYHYAMNIVAGNRPVNLRGTGGYGERTLVLVDGIPQNNPYNGWVEWSQIPKEAIERIEVMRGPASALYGSNAMGGVINIVTKKPEKSSETVLQQKYGSMNTSLTKLVQDGRFGKFIYYLTGEYEETDGYIGTEPRQTYDIKRFRKEDRILGRLIYDLDKDSEVCLGFSHYYAKKGGGREFMYGYNDNNNFWLNWSRDGEKVGWLASLRLNDDEWINLYDAPPYTYRYRKETIPASGWGGSIQSTVNVLKWYKVVAGVDYSRNALDKKDEYYTTVRSGGAQGAQTSIAPFLQNEARWLDGRLIANLGGRYDWIKSYDGENWDTNPPAYANDFPSHQWRNFSPKLGLVYHLDKDTTFKTSAGNGFKAPSLYQLYTPYIQGPLLIESNPELQPEKVFSYDLGMEHSLLDNLVGRLTVYQSNARDYIDYYMITPFRWKTDNIAKVKMQGAEAGLDWHWSRELSALVDYTYNKSQIIEYPTDPTVEDNYLAYTPLNTYKCGLAYKKPELVEFQALVNYNGKRYANNQNTAELRSYYTFNLSVMRQFGRHSRLALDVENLFDKDYTVYKGPTQDIISPGRVVNLSLKIDF